MSRGRKTIEFDISKLQNIINKVEQEKEYAARDQLYNDVAARYLKEGGLNGNKLTKILIYLRVKSGVLSVKTPMGRRGAGLHKGGPNSPANPTPKRDYSTHFKILKKYILEQGYGVQGTKNTPQHARTYRMVQRAEKGSLRAKINLKCLDCSNYQREEIRNCECLDCPLFSIRPYQ